jgi:hypothetical protein
MMGTCYASGRLFVDAHGQVHDGLVGLGGSKQEAQCVVVDDVCTIISGIGQQRKEYEPSARSAQSNLVPCE